MNLAPQTTFNPDPIFQQDWWLHAAAGTALRKVQVVWNGKEVAALHFMEERRYGFTCLTMPPFTRVAGPRLSLPRGSSADRMKNLRRATRELISLLPKFHSFKQIFDPEDETAAFFAIEGFSVARSYTCRVASDSSLEDLWERMDPKRRKNIKARQGDLVVEFHRDLHRFEALARKEYSDKANTYNFPTLHNLFEEALTRNCVGILTAQDRGKKDLCSAILLWDDRNLYFWLATRDHEGTERGAKSLLVWESIKLAFDKGLTFDFDSYGSITGFRFMMSFGFSLASRSLVLKADLPIRMALGMRREWIDSNQRVR